ncbi:mannose-6-phosphate isomerase, class I [Stackebrandtia soli]|uniref:mannose-6-phosphate isomerase, class I n=1 Tax=Stackebrandtia soli TaxID=1892856 RepID=UPI0039EBE020
MELLDGAIRRYPWGSRTAIAALQGRPMPSATPEAELWFGAYESAPATLSDGRSLTSYIGADPTGVLGPDSVKRFGSRLPFLLKVLAADEPLSLQVHPSREQAEEGFARENEDGVPPDSPLRNYVDANHKPELLCAMADFEVLCGFRDPRHSASVLERLGLGGLSSVVALLRQTDPVQALRETVTTLLTLPMDHHGALMQEAIGAAAPLAAGGGDDASDFAMLIDLGKRYPNDPGVFVTLLLNHVTLRPGEAIYMPAGNPHAYLSGVGVEIMAASDNVLRGGLTRKHVDVPELLRVLDFRVLAEPLARPRTIAPGLAEWPVDVADFRLARLRLDQGAAETPIPIPGPKVLLCWSGQVRLDDGRRPITLRPGQAGFASADAGDVYASGFGEVFCAGIGAFDR